METRRLLVDRTAKQLYHRLQNGKKSRSRSGCEFREETQTGSGAPRPHQVCRSNAPSGANMRRLFLLKSSLFVVVFASTVLQCQQLAVQTDTGRQILSRADLEALPHVKVTASDHSSAPVSFEGVTLKSVLEKAGVTFGESMKGKRLSNCLLVEAADGYRVVIALPELDPAFTDKTIVLALLRDGKPLDEKEGPYRIVIPDEKRMARWIKQVTSLKIVDVQ